MTFLVSVHYDYTLANPLVYSILRTYWSTLLKVKLFFNCSETQSQGFRYLVMRNLIQLLLDVDVLTMVSMKLIN